MLPYVHKNYKIIAKLRQVKRWVQESGVDQKYSPVKICSDANSSSQPQRPHRSSPKAGRAVMKRTAVHAAAFPVVPDSENVRSHKPSWAGVSVQRETVRRIARSSPAVMQSRFNCRRFSDENKTENFIRILCLVIVASMLVAPPTAHAGIFDTNNISDSKTLQSRINKNSSLSTNAWLNVDPSYKLG